MFFFRVYIVTSHDVLGTKGTTFYIILKGSVAVMIPDWKNLGELKEIAALKAGMSFGEMALLLDAPRNATIKCKEDCDFAVVHRKEFNEVLAKAELRKVQDKIDFFMSLPIFAKHSRRNISTLIYHFEMIKFNKGETIYTVGDEPNNVYIVYRG
jgi:CRP-like cAMP-binding protein